MKYGLILDLETTGLDCNNDKIIEIGIIKMALDENYKAHIIETYSELEDPKVQINELTENLTGLNNTLVEGRKINWEKIIQDVRQSSFVVAHNMPFDRSFIEQREELKKEKIHWACSQRHINWKKHGFKSQALNYLACDHGFVNPFPHRALFDCATTFRLISPYMEELLKKSYENEFELLATGAPFKYKDKLKERGYYWNPEKRVWFKNVFETDLEEERQFLTKTIYSGKSLFEERKI